MPFNSSRRHWSGQWTGVSLHPVSPLLRQTHNCSLFAPNFPSVWPHSVPPPCLRPQPRRSLSTCACVCACMCVTAKSYCCFFLPFSIFTLSELESRCLNAVDSSSLQVAEIRLLPNHLPFIRLLLCLPGFRRNEEIRAMEVLPILKEKVAFLSGETSRANEVEESGK